MNLNNNLSNLRPTSDLKTGNSYTILLVNCPKFPIPFSFLLYFHCLKSIWMDIQSFWLKTFLFLPRCNSLLKYSLPMLPYIFKSLEKLTDIHHPHKLNIFHIFSHALVLFKQDCRYSASLSSRMIISQVLCVEVKLLFFKLSEEICWWALDPFLV